MDSEVNLLSVKKIKSECRFKEARSGEEVCPFYSTESLFNSAYFTGVLISSVYRSYAIHLLK